MIRPIPIHTHLLNVIISTVKSKGKVKILDAGCGILNFSRYLLEHLGEKYVEGIQIFGYEIADYYSIERLENVIKNDSILLESGIKNNLFIVKIDNYSLPFDDNFFDIIVSNQVVEHVSNLEEFYSEQRRILRPDGFQIHCFPTKEILIEPHLKIPIIHKILNKSFALSYLKYMYSLKGVKDNDFIAERFHYVNNDTNYKSLSWHIKTLKELNMHATSAYNIYVPIVKILNLLGYYKNFRYLNLGFVERIIATFTNLFYSTTIIVRKN